jgi:hypothetical protein
MRKSWLIGGAIAAMAAGFIAWKLLSKKAPALPVAPVKPVNPKEKGFLPPTEWPPGQRTAKVVPLIDLSSAGLVAVEASKLPNDLIQGALTEPVNNAVMALMTKANDAGLASSRSYTYLKYEVFSSPQYRRAFVKVSKMGSTNVTWYVDVSDQNIIYGGGGGGVQRWGKPMSLDLPITSNWVSPEKGKPLVDLLPAGFQQMTTSNVPSDIVPAATALSTDEHNAVQKLVGAAQGALGVRLGWGPYKRKSSDQSVYVKVEQTGTTNVTWYVKARYHMGV